MRIPSRPRQCSARSHLGGPKAIRPRWFPFLSTQLRILTLGVALVAYSSCAEVVGNVTGYTNQGHSVTVACGLPKVRIDFWADDVVRVWLSPDGSFSYYGGADDSYMIQPGLKQFTGPTQFQVTDAGAYIRIQSSRMTLRVQKTPFGLEFYQADNQTLITSTPPGQCVDTDVKAYLKRDASGQLEHFFGLQFSSAPVTTLDRRGDTVSLEDRNGNGWPAPFMMSSAGYGLFFHNEDGAHTRFALTDPIVIENTATNGQMDLFFMYGPEFKHLLNLYTGITGKPPMPPKKLMGFQYLVQGTPMTSAEAFPDWVDRGYPIDSCITFTDARVETPSQIAAVAATAQQIHSRNGLFGFYYDVNLPGTFGISRPEPTTAPYTNWTAFTNLLKTRLLDNGVDWFWIDETDDNWPPRFKFNLYRSMVSTMEAQDTRRGFLCARGGYAGCQRFGYPWMGDSDYNRDTVMANLCNGLIGIPFSTHDMAGAGLVGKSEFGYLAGVKANFLNPFSQCNSWIPGQNPSHRPWEWSELAENVFFRFDTLHYQLIPYFYSTAWQAHNTGMPVWRPLLLEYPGNSNYYASDEILVGDWLLMAPLYWQVSRTVQIPPGKWYYLFDGTVHVGPRSLTNFSPTTYGYPIFVKAGAIIPLSPSMRYVDEVPSDLILLIYPDGTSSYTVYEDDGITRDYLTGGFATTEVVCAETVSTVDITLHARLGGYVPPARNILLKVCNPTEPVEVRANGLLVQRFETLNALDTAVQGWCYAVDNLTGLFQAVIKLPDTGAATAVQLVRSPSGPFPPQQMGHALFTKTDRTTQSGWVGKYGSGGYWLPGDDSHLGGGNQVTTTSSNVLLSVAGCTEAPVCLYLKDLNSNSVATIQVSDPGTGRIFDSRSVTNAENGIYFLYSITRAANFRILNQAGSSNMLAGVFFNGVSNTFLGFDTVAAAAFIEADTNTAGNWINRYGNLGYSVVSAGELLSTNIVLQYGGTRFVWGDFVFATNALQRPGQNGRIAACQFGSEVTIDVGVRGTRSRVVSFYFLDWDGAGQRAFTIKAVDPVSCEVFDTRQVSSFGSGIYMRYAVKGHARFILTSTAGANAVVSGVFADPPLTDFQRWQLTYFGGTTHPNAAPEADPDQDGLSNQVEFNAGTNPALALPSPWITQVKREKGGVRTTWYATGGQTNIVQVTSNLAGASFVDLSPPILLPPGAGFLTNHLDSTSTNSPGSRFYRIKRIP